MKKRLRAQRGRTALVVVGAICVFAQPAFTIERFATRTGVPLNVWLTVAGVAATPLWYDMEGLGLAYESDGFTAGFDFVLNNDRKYTPSEIYMFGRYFDLLDGRVETRLGDLAVTAGRITHRDELDTPYSLFISSADIASTVVDVRYESDYFFYDTRWIELNRQSSLYTYQQPVYDETDGSLIGYTEVPLDRGANYKVYGVHLGNLRFGLQESVVYLNQTFYPEYFLSPLPMYFTQLVNSTEGKPWTQIANENSLMGVFTEYQWPNASVFGQILLDDWNDTFLRWATTEDHDNPAKFAWSLGGTIGTAIGTVGFYNAGATKYTFESTYADAENFNRYPYSYTYYPVSEYTANGELMPILPEDNYIGYLYGENNLAFRATLDNTFGGVRTNAMVEYTISGAKSPSNPWHEAVWHSSRRSEFLNDDRLEHRAIVVVNAEYWLGPLRISGSLTLGGVWNELELTPVDGAPDEQGIFVPSDTNRFIWEIGLQLQYALGIPVGQSSSTE
jgi:hypothetical protein